MKARLKEPSTWAGIGVLGHALTMLLASKGADPMAWAQFAAGVAAVIVPEQSGKSG